MLMQGEIDFDNNNDLEMQQEKDRDFNVEVRIMICNNLPGLFCLLKELQSDAFETVLPLTKDLLDDHDYLVRASVSQALPKLCELSD